MKLNNETGTESKLNLSSKIPALPTSFYITSTLHCLFSTVLGTTPVSQYLFYLYETA